MPNLFALDHRRAVAALVIGVLAIVTACEDETSPGPVPADIEIVSGNGQYSKQGTELEDPVRVAVTLTDGEPAAGVPVNFAVRSGGGSLSRTTANTDADGETSVRWTLGPDIGTQEITISVAGDSDVRAIAQATSSTFYCPEEDPTFARRFPQNNLFVLTRRSSVVAAGGPDRVGLVQVAPNTLNLEFDAVSFVGFDETILQAVPRDCAFAANGEFYIAWTSTSSVREIRKIFPDRSSTHFARLEGILGTEITTTEGAVLGGCDEFGPFTVGCRDTLTRYSDAIFDGTTTLANHDAVAYDATGNYLYFIDETARRLRRVPLDGYTQTGPTEEAAVLTADEAENANGMVVHNQTVYILVDSPTTKEILSVSSTGTKQTELDFFTRGAGDAAGVQNDLALWVAGAVVALYTVDTLNDVLLLFQIGPDQLFELVPDDDTDAGAISKVGTDGERLGLAVMP
ncbi:MAG TPA: hypothetical protein VFU38_00585 [Candidatus Krumholzibacteria bacterium]|nr:hypothetical protein [Candidatus Krumholzibacteria bacterium]